MLRPRDQQRAAALAQALIAYQANHHPLPGIADPVVQGVLVEQMLESIHRIEYVSRIRNRPISPARADPTSELFDPLKAALLKFSAGDLDEACWLVFLFVHFGKSSVSKWRLARDVYGALGTQAWTWQRVSANPGSFRNWLATNQSILRGADGVVRQFGAHRPYQSLSATSSSGTGAAVESYIGWVGPTRTHSTRFNQALQATSGDPKKTFNALYRSMSVVKSFGRLARFDFLAMLGKLGFLAITPDSTYMSNSTGPIRGARLLFGNNLNARTLEIRLAEFDSYANVGMQVLEDALCNWQKSPGQFVAFRG